MSGARCKAEGRNGNMYRCIVLYLYLYLYPFSPVAAAKAKQPLHGMSLVAAAWSRLPRAATSPGAVVVGMQKRGQRQGQRQGHRQGHRQGQEQGQGQKNIGALQGWMKTSETTPGAGYGASNASPPSPPFSSSRQPSSPSSSPPTSAPPPTATKTSSSNAMTPRKPQPESMQSTLRATTAKPCKAATTATRTKNISVNDSIKPKSSKALNSEYSETAPEKRAKHTPPAPAAATATATATATAARHKSPQGKSTGRQPQALAVGVAATPTKTKVTALVSTVAGGLLAAAGWLLVRASSSSGQAISADHSQDKCENTWNPFIRDSQSHTMGGRHPSWSNRPNNPNDDDAPPGGDQVGDSQASSAQAPPVQGRGQEVDAKEGNGGTNVRAEDDEQRGGGQKTDGEIEREWPVFGSDGVGGRFGAF